jgi:rhodanese-related sulfurtransferase
LWDDGKPAVETTNLPVTTVLQFSWFVTYQTLKSMTTKTPNVVDTGDFFANKSVLTIRPAQVNQLLRTKFLTIIVDVRETKDFIKGHVPKAINLPIGNWSKISGLKYDLTLIIYCYSKTCTLVAQAVQEFARHGYPVIEMQGGFEAWKESKLPVEI